MASGAAGGAAGAARGAPSGSGAPRGKKRQRGGEKSCTEASTPPPPKRAKPVAEIGAEERRREAEIVGRKAEEAEKKAARLWARQRELLGETLDEEITQEKEKEKQGTDPENDIVMDASTEK